MFYDVDEDGLQDLLLSGSSIYRAIGDESNGQIAFYRNVGSASNPAFTLISDDWLGLSLLGYFRYRPCFGDIDNDGLDDMLLGNSEGRLIHFERDAIGSFVFDTTFYCGIDVGNSSHPTLYDVDEDGDLDLVGKEYLGQIDFYPNVNPLITSPFQFDSLNSNFGEISVSEAGFLIGNAVPHFIELEGKVILLVGGVRKGNCVWAGFDSLFSGSFSVVAIEWGGIDVGAEAAPFAYDINGDGFMDVLYGNRRGGLSLYSTVVTDSSQVLSLTSSDLDNKLSLYPSPAFSQLAFQEL